MKIGFIGAGNMGGAILRGVLASAFCPPEDIAVSEPKAGSWEVLSYNDNARLVRESDVILFCVKPFLLGGILKDIKAEVSPSKLFISIAAGISTKTIEAALGAVPLVRVMPNTPASLGWGMSALSPGSHAKEGHLKLVQGIFDSVGRTVRVDEAQMDMVTAISGSGPAFFYYIADSMAKAGEEAGLSYETALLLAAQTAVGSGRMLLDTGKSPGELITDVVTPGGTTAAGLVVLKERETGAILAEALGAAERRSRELGK